MSYTNFSTVPHGSPDWKEAVMLRENVLRKPLGSYFTEEELAAEQDHIHVIGKSNDAVIATAVLVPEPDAFKMQRVAVKSEMRNQNIGAEMMVYCEEIAHQNKISRLYCHARDTAVNFYKQNGYYPEGKEFLEDGIPHLKMIKDL